jgi:ABC-type polysaccharide/polyol phosphate transport system ATPase subunit
VIDEILAVGDTAFQSKCFDRLKNFREAGKTILFVTHSVQQVLAYCDRAILLRSGDMILDGTPEAVVEEYAPGTVAAAAALAEANTRFLESVQQ